MSLVSWIVKAVAATIAFAATLLLISAVLASEDRSYLMSIGVALPVGLIVWLCWRNMASASGVDETTVPNREGLFEGVGAAIEVRESGIAITREGDTSFFLHGLKGEKRIAYGSISAIQLRDATQRMSGYIQFTVAGGVEGKRGIFEATHDENTVMFTHAQMPAFHRLRDIVESRLSASLESTRSSGDELTKLANLHERGYLTDAEFAAQKALLLSA